MDDDDDDDDDDEVRLSILIYSEYCKIKNSCILATEFECFLLSQSSCVGFFSEQKFIGTGLFPLVQPFSLSTSFH